MCGETTDGEGSGGDVLASAEWNGSLLPATNSSPPPPSLVDHLMVRLQDLLRFLLSRAHDDRTCLMCSCHTDLYYSDAEQGYLCGKHAPLELKVDLAARGVKPVGV